MIPLCSTQGWGDPIIDIFILKGLVHAPNPDFSIKMPWLCPTWERGIAWDLREMGSAWGRGVREGLSPQKARKISSQRSVREEATWRRKRKEGQVGRDEEGPARTEKNIVTSVICV
jgi:hypothetical protein